MDTAARGRAAEDRAARFLLEQGYRLIERNYVAPIGELDIVAEEGGDLVFVEVRSRADAAHGDATVAVGKRKQAQVARVAEHYLGARAPRCESCRFDVVAITGDEIVLFKDAFRVGLP